MRFRAAFIASTLLGLLGAPELIAQQVQPSDATEVVTLADLLEEAENVHPAIKAEASIVKSKSARVPQVKALPDPTVKVGWMGNITPFSVQHLDPSSYRGISAMQELPYPGKLGLRGQIAEKDVDAEKWNLEATRRQVRAAVKSAYF